MDLPAHCTWAVSFPQGGKWCALLQGNASLLPFPGCIPTSMSLCFASLLAGRELVCDIQGNAYPQPFQEAFGARRLLAASPQVGPGASGD